MASTDNKLKPLIAIIVAAAVLLAVGYGLIVAPVSGVAVIDSSTAIGVVAVLFLVTGVWVFKNSGQEGGPSE